MIEQIITVALSTWKLMFESEIVVRWFVISTIITTYFAMKINHLSVIRILKYAALFSILLVAIEGPVINYSVVVLGRPLNTPNLWIHPIFVFTLFACLLSGITLGFICNKILDLFFDDFWLSVATKTYLLADSQMKRSKAYASLGFNTVEEFQKILEDKQAEEDDKLKAKIE